jgi:hypothetical protein
MLVTSAPGTFRYRGRVCRDVRRLARGQRAGFTVYAIPAARAGGQTLRLRATATAPARGRPPGRTALRSSRRASRAPAAAERLHQLSRPRPRGEPRPTDVRPSGCGRPAGGVLSWFWLTPLHVARSTLLRPNDPWAWVARRPGPDPASGVAFCGPGRGGRGGGGRPGQPLPPALVVWLSLQPALLVVRLLLNPALVARLALDGLQARRLHPAAGPHRRWRRRGRGVAHEALERRHDGGRLLGRGGRRDDAQLRAAVGHRSP